jgi:phage gp46-like protein
MSDFTISNGALSDKIAEQDSIYNLLWTSITIEKGTFFADPDFGSKLSTLRREKNAARARQLAEQYAREATEWILKAGKATSIEVFSEVDSSDKNRINIKITAINKIGREVNFQTFVEVV